LHHHHEVLHCHPLPGSRHHRFRHGLAHGQYSHLSYSTLARILTSLFALQLQERGVDEGLVPDFGVERGVLSTTQPGACFGLNDVNMQCTCPPDRDVFLEVSTKPT
jgi:hypothetical protein